MIKVEVVMADFVTIKSDLTSLVIHISHFSDIDFAGYMVSGVAKVIKVEVVTVIFVPF